MKQYYLHLNKKEYNERWSEVKDYFPNWESEDLSQSMRSSGKQQVRPLSLNYLY